ncbi:MAG: aspartate 1-decarboxylase [Ruminococcus sp.]|nr:aspartate 1-decarboxylase [Ruminococcus sp.]
MMLNMMKGKIHRATVTQAELNYVGSITIDAALLEAAGILEYEAVQVVNIANGNRFLTYTIAGERNSGVICLNGAAARQAQTDDKVIIMAYAQMTPEEAAAYQPRVVLVDAQNAVQKMTHYEKHGELA